MAEMSGTVTRWLQPGQPLAGWWQAKYPQLRSVARELTAGLRAVRSGPGSDPVPGPTGAFTIPLDTPGLRYFDYALLGGAIDYRLRMEFTGRWGGDPERSAFTRAWAGRRGSLANAAAGMLSDCAPMLARSRPERGQPHPGPLWESLPLLCRLLEEYAARVDELAPWDWHQSAGPSRREEPWLLDYCLVLADLDDFYRRWGSRPEWGALFSPLGYRSVRYATGEPLRSGFSQSNGPDEPGSPPDERAAHEAAGRIVSELVRSWPLFAHLCRTDRPSLEGLAAAACRHGSHHLLRQDLAGQLELWRRNAVRRAAAPPRVIAANPTFAGSTRLSADGDLLLRDPDGTGFLVDFKSGKRVETSGMLLVLRQVLTYALMDERDDYEIRHVGFYFTRYGQWHRWDVQELLDGSAAEGQPRTVDRHCQALVRFLLDLRQPEPLDVLLPRA